MIEKKNYLLPFHYPENNFFEYRSLLPASSPEKISNDLLQTEKEIAAETLKIIRSRYEKEKSYWNKIYTDKEQEILVLRKRLSEAEEKITIIRKQFEDERQVRFEQLSITAREYESRRKSDKRKWEIISEEVKSFRNFSVSAQKKLIEKEEEISKIKKIFFQQKQTAEQQLKEKTEEFLNLKEQNTAKEESLLASVSKKNDEIHSLQEQLASIQQAINDERAYNGKITEKKDSDLDKVQKALQDTVIQLNLERESTSKIEKKSIEQQKQIDELENEIKNITHEYEQEKFALMKAFKESEAAWEKDKQEFSAREESLKQDNEEQVQRMAKSMEIVEQQLADEQLINKEIEEKIQKKEQEVQALLKQKEEAGKEWKNILSIERDSWQKRQNDIIAEFEKLKQVREDEFNSLKQEINVLNGAIAEEKRLYLIEKEHNKQLSDKNKYYDEDKRRIIEQMQQKEKEWEFVFENEQKMFSRQTEEIKNQCEAQLKSRDLEITRMDEDINILNGQLMELRQKLSLEKNENNNRINRIQDLESQIKDISAKYNKERLEWYKKLQFIQTQWEEQYKIMNLYQSDVDNQYLANIKNYQDKIRDLNLKLMECMQDSNMKKDNKDTEQKKETAEHKNLKFNNRFYPGK